MNAVEPLALDHVEALAPASQVALARLAARPWIGETYLAGSAALALYTGHRPVRDLDLMTQANRLMPQERRDLLGDLLLMDPATRVETARDGYLFVRLAGDVGLRLFYYPYPLVDPEQELARAPGLLVASPVDLGLMKLGAIISRGSRRDFVDLYLLCRRLDLALLLGRAEDKFGHVGDFALQALKGLADRSAVEGEPMPKLALPLAWEEVEAWLDEEVRTLGRAHADLSRD
jgi:Nucleotidyl transferase AbiEii toxin, Type IV TA system